MMKMLVNFNTNPKLALLSYTLIGTLLSNTVVLPAVATETGASVKPSPLPAPRLLPSYGGAGKNIGSVSASASAMLKKVSIRDPENLIYINARNLTDKASAFTFSQMRERILQEGMRYFIDFSDIGDKEKKAAAKKVLTTLLGVGPSCDDMLLISQYKGELIYTPFDKSNTQILQTALTRSPQIQKTIGNRLPPSQKEANGGTLPHIAFYLEVNRPISDQECTFPVSHLWNRGNRSFCDKANISLIYRVNLMRSLSHRTVGSATPDAKLVRITIDEDSHGAGIHLNSSLRTDTQKLGLNGLNWNLNSWWRSYATGAIAKDYRFSTSASNKTAAILKTHPATNLNVVTDVRESSGFEIGVAGGPEIDSGGDKGAAAKAKLEASLSYNQSRMLLFRKHDYSIVRAAPNAQEISFTWLRETNPTASSMLGKKTGAVWNDSHPVDPDKINPIAYTGFTPSFDVIYKAAPDARGSTDFTVDSSVNIWPVYTAAYYHFYGVGSHLSFQGQEHWQKEARINKSCAFTVDWNHPVFTGGRPVNLQLGAFNNKCISYGENAKVEIAECNMKSRAQSFIYDESGRYVSATDTDKCLDETNLGVFQSCNGNLSQRWKWVENSDHLQNEYRGQYLAHDSENGELSSVPENAENSNLRIITKFTDIFSL